MEPPLQVHLAQGLETGPLRDVDQVPDLDGVAGEERERLEQAAAARVLAGERLDEARQVRVEQVDERARDQLGDPASAAFAEHASLDDRALVVTLDVLDPRLHEKRAQRAVGHPWVPVADIRVAPHDDVARRLEQAFPERLALPAVRAVARQHVRVLDDAGTLAGRDLARRVLGGGVDHDQLVHERDGLHEHQPCPTDDGTDRRRLVQCR